MQDYYWSGWYTGWGWILWFGLIFVMFSSFGNWGYTYRAHRLFRGKRPTKNAIDLLNDRYARGDIGNEEYLKVRFHINGDKEVNSHSIYAAKKSMGEDGANLA